MKIKQLVQFYVEVEGADEDECGRKMDGILGLIVDHLASYEEVSGIEVCDE